MAEEKKWYVCKYDAHIRYDAVAEKYENIKEAEKEALYYFSDRIKGNLGYMLDPIHMVENVSCRQATHSEVERGKKFIREVEREFGKE